jgi:hypothetical protein
LKRSRGRGIPREGFGVVEQTSEFGVTAACGCRAKRLGRIPRGDQRTEQTRPASPTPKTENVYIERRSFGGLGPLLRRPRPPQHHSQRSVGLLPLCHGPCRSWWSCIPPGAPPGEHAEHDMRHNERDLHILVLGKAQADFR